MRYYRNREMAELEAQEKPVVEAHEPTERLDENGQYVITPAETKVLTSIRLDDGLEKVPDDSEFDFSQEGVSPKVADGMRKIAIENLALRARTEAEMFRQTHPQYVPSQRSFTLLTSLMVLNDLAPTRENFTWAWRALLNEGLLKSQSQEEKEGISTKSSYSDAQLEAMSADEYARAVGLKRGDSRNPYGGVGVTVGRTYYDKPSTTYGGRLKGGSRR